MEGITNQTLCDFRNPTSHHKPLSLSSFASFLDNYPHGFPRKVFAEVIGTYLLVFVGSGSAGLSAIDERNVSKLGASLAGGFIVTVLIYSIGHISGAHLNPAVSLAFATVRHFPWKQVPFYVAAQVTGAISAAYTLRVLLEPATQIGATSPSGSNIQALIMEIVSTFTMVFISTAAATDPKAIRELGGVAVGFSVCIASIVAGPISGGSMNPARTLGPAIASASYKGLWVYFLGPVTGAILGAWCYVVIQDRDNKSTLTEISLPSSSLNLRHQRNITSETHHEQVGNNEHQCSL